MSDLVIQVEGLGKRYRICLCVARRQVGRREVYLTLRDTLVNAVKKPFGLFQVPRISWTDLKVRPDMNLSERFLLYYTGLRRMAKNILQSIVGRYPLD